MTAPVCFVVNPRAGGGRMAASLESLRRAVARHTDQGEVLLTDHPGHATELARTARDRGAARVIAVGGDGTASEVVNGLLAGDGPGEVVFGVVHGGTGGDLVKTLAMPSGLDQGVRVACSTDPRATDATRVTLGAGDAARTRFGINVTGFGSNGDVVRRANASSKRLGGTITFLTAAARTTVRYRPALVRVRYWTGDGQEHTWCQPLQSAFVANGAYCGGGMWVGRGGTMQDGLLDLTLIPQMPTWKLALHASRLFTGTIGEVAEVLVAQVRRLEAEPVDAADEVLVDVDGEQPGALPLAVEVLPGALLVAGVWMH